MELHKNPFKHMFSEKEKENIKASKPTRTLPLET